MQTVMITGGTGTIGKHLSAMLVKRGYKVIILTRGNNTGSNHPGITMARWDVKRDEIDVAAIQQADYIIHLAGANVADGRWTKKRKKEIVESRTKSSALLVKALKENEHKVSAVISASATGWYGEDTLSSRQYGFKEDAPAAKDFLGNTCRFWEESIEPVTRFGVRLVKLRTGIVLSNDGGAWIEFKKPLKAGIAAIMGSGRQVVPWIHIEDICRLYVYAIENKKLAGSYNAVSPNAVTNKTLVLQMARQRNHFYIPVHVPALALKIALGEMSIEILKSVTASAEKIQSAGFAFLYPAINEAVRELSGLKG
jgi:uncharacterized protein (TIGR01777 family)